MASKNTIEFAIRVVDEATRSLRSIGSRMVDFTRRVAAGAAKLTAAFTAAAGALFQFMNRTTQGFDELDKLSTRLNVSVESLSQLQFIADRSGISFRNMTLALQRMARRVSEASVGLGEAQLALDELNLSAQDLNRLSPDRQFKVLAKAISEVENPADRLRLAFKLFDSEGVAVLQTLEGGIEGFEELARKSDELGATLSEVAVDRARDFQDGMANMRGALRGVAEEFVLNLGPAMTDLVNIVAQNLPLAFAKMEKWLIQARQKLVQFAFALVVTAKRALELTDVVSNIWGKPGTNTARIQALDELAEALHDQAEAYEPLIEAAKEYERTLKNVTVASTGLTEPTATVGRSLNDGLEEIVIKAKRRFSRSRATSVFDPLVAAAEEAARSIQSAFSDFFFDPFEEGLRGLVKGFIDAVRRMIAEILAFQTVSRIPGLGDLLGVSGGGGGLGGLVGVGAKNGSFQPITNIDARGATQDLVKQLPQVLEQNNKSLMLKVKQYVDTGRVPL